jgi:hypothetical protein
LHQPLTGRVDIVDLISQVPEVARLPVVLVAVPIVSEFDLRPRPALLLRFVERAFVAGCGEEDKRIAALVVDAAAGLLQPELVAVEVQRGVEIAHAQHGVQKSHRIHPFVISAPRSRGAALTRLSS